jgi:ABC-type lipoprotein release transport system permease subunit
MNIPLLFARRYLLAKRSRNAVNIITGISIVVIAVVTAAMVVVLSTLNGIGELVEKMYSPFDQDLTITPAEGKTFDREAFDLEALRQRLSVADAAWTIEENVLLRCGDQQAVATLKGVEPQYLAMSRMEEHLYTGEAALYNSAGPTAIMGIALKVDLDVPLDDGLFQPLGISAPIRGRKISAMQQRAFEHTSVAVSGSFSMNMDFDAKYVVVPLDLADELLQYEGQVNALELQLPPNARLERSARLARDMLGDDFVVRTRYQKNELMYRTNASEKLFTFIVLAFIGLIGAFNIIASLTMMMIEKRNDMRTLMSMGATSGTVRAIFFNEGLLIVLSGTVAGLLLGLGICWAQIQFGLVELHGSIVDHYPVKVLPLDLVIVFVSIMIIGLLASWVPLRSLGRRFLHTGMGPVQA